MANMLNENAQHAHEVAQKAWVVSIIHKELLEKLEGRIKNLENKSSDNKKVL
jgi:hypothetical protein